MRPWSCDTFAALADTGPGGRVLVGKNSDRPVGDAQPLCFLPRRTAQQSGGRLRLAYLEIDDVPKSAAHIGGSPYWCWGHEQGLNEHGVAIGNEALFTRDWAAAVCSAEQGEEPERGILGMELVRLGLERGRNAGEALETICNLVKRHGQWGSGVPGEPPVSGGYDNSFLIADSCEAWILETSGRNWVARRVTSGTVAVSNQPTIRTQWDRASSGLVEHAVRQGWWSFEPADQPFDFARSYVDPKTPLQLSHIRLQRSRQLLREAVASGGEVSVQTGQRILRDHYEDTFLGGPYFNAAVPDFLSLCMHSHPSDFTWGDTAASTVFVLPTEEQCDQHLPHLWWSPVTPCTGVYVPVFVDAGGLPETVSAAGTAGHRPQRPENATKDAFDERSYWWRFQELLERAKGGPGAPQFARNQPVIRQAFDVLELRWAARLPQVEREGIVLRDLGRDGEMRTVLREFTEACVTEALATADALISRIGA
ncbi:MAG: C69 family dipeptidase [Streptomyces sp.]|uniref:C69 family dipeptidase n=1 Tax=Streptomyces sp. TaxID=1931 RepID=UPI003D6B41D8